MENDKKKRVRKKACQIDSIEKLRSNTKKASSVVTTTRKNESSKKDLNQSHISFGKFNITINKAPQMSADDIRDYYDKKFGINESEKTAKLLVQESSDVPIPEPLTEHSYRHGGIEPVKNWEKTTKKTAHREIHKVLAKFIDGCKTEWPESTDLLCWHCSHQFEGTPIPCPVEYDDIRERYNVNGVFCSWACVAAFRSNLCNLLYGISVL